MSDITSYCREDLISELTRIQERLHVANESNRQLREELELEKLINKRACDDWSHDDTKVKELLKPHLPGDDLESDGYGFRGVIAVAELAAARFTALENALREAREALSKCANEETYHEYYRLTATKALQTLSALNIK